MMDTELAWEQFCLGKKTSPAYVAKKKSDHPCPAPSSLYISTRTKIGYLSTPIDLLDTFWQLPVVPHHEPTTGIIKKQMKMTSHSEEELESLMHKLPKDCHVAQYVIEHLDEVEGRISYKDVRKISIGVCNKDVSSYRCKKKGAFYNCFSLIVRVNYEDRFYEMHVKVFNTGKMEVPGVQNSEVFRLTIELLCKCMRENTSHENVQWQDELTQTVLINSNFAAGFLIDREILFDTLRSKYGIQGRYDPCSYPGIQCNFYFDPLDKNPTGALSTNDQGKSCQQRMSFMVFRTGSVLIVGKCTEESIRRIYSSLVRILIAEYRTISTGLAPNIVRKKVKSQRLKTTIVTSVNLTVEE
jgi:TATA-box binding protein (TBP) (component of TFIID and TFIIIB)